ncbi:MAG: nucleoside/nucleotide kinase family protein [Actinomycetota bacterium]|nr:nucleoside/nucleotide kinase family protein [Actinomycetota bacterium]
MTGLDQLATEIRNAAATAVDRTIVAIAGPPGAGKSTLVDQLLGTLGESPPVAILPMDGFHLDNRILELRGQSARRGAPFTFDAAGFVATMGRVRRDDVEVFVPSFDRSADLARAGAIRIGTEHRIVLAEGNYLLLDEAPWSQIRHMADLSVFIDVEAAVLESRLVRRWLDYGLSAAAARRRAEDNDLVNARLVLDRSSPPHYVYRPATSQ